METSEDELNADGSPANPRRLCRVQRVEEVKCVVRVLPIWVAGVLYFVAIVQQNTYVVFQALQSDGRLHGSDFEISAASYSASSMLALTIWVPIYDRLIVPSLRRVTGKPAGISLLQKIGIGLCLSVPTMLVTAAIEQWRSDSALTRPPVGIEERRWEISSLSGLWLVPQLAVSGLAEAFASVGMMEFYYEQFPENKRSIGAAFFLTGIAAGNYLSGLLVKAVHRITAAYGAGNWLPEDLNKGRLDRFYLLVGGLGMVNLGYYMVCARWYQYKGTAGGGG